MQTLNVAPILSNLARFAIMRASRPRLDLTGSAPQDAIEHLYSLREWARRHDHSRCYCSNRYMSDADTYRCPACTLRTCECCDQEYTMVGDQVCDRCLRDADDELTELRSAYGMGDW